MRRLRFDALLRMSAALVILNQEVSSSAPWVMNEEQREVLAEVLEHQYTIVLKGRQVGVSTVVLLVVMAFAIANPGVNCAIVADTAEKAEGLLARLGGWLKQLGCSLDVDNTRSITLPNGTTIDALSAVSRADEGESRVGRSKSYALLHLSEVGFWANDAAVFAGLTSTALPSAKIIIESTASAAENLFKKLWNDETNGWRHVFLPIERHVVYRADPTTISDETWEALQAAHGFTRRDTAAWWYRKMTTAFGGDAQRALREFPIIPDHCFAFAEGRWILKHTSAVGVIEHGTWTDGRYDGWTTYGASPGEPVLFGVDTGAGLGADASAIGVIGEVTGRLYATFTSATTSVDDFVDVVDVAADRWHPKAVIVEVNGIGRGVQSALAKRLACEVVEQTSGAEKHQRLTRLKVAIESGRLPIGPELVAEAQSSRIKKPTGAGGAPVYVGRDDLLNAVSFADWWRMTQMAASEPVRPTAAVDPRTHYVSAAKKPRRARAY